MVTVADFVHGSAGSRAVRAMEDGQGAPAISPALERKNRTALSGSWSCIEGSGRRAPERPGGAKV